MITVEVPLPINSLYSTKELNLKDTLIPRKWKRWRLWAGTGGLGGEWQEAFSCVLGKFGEVLEYFQYWEEINRTIIFGRFIFIQNEQEISILFRLGIY